MRDERVNCRRKMRFLHSPKTTIVENVAEKRGWRSKKKREREREGQRLATSQLSNQDGRDINRVVKVGARCEKWCYSIKCIPMHVSLCGNSNPDSNVIKITTTNATDKEYILEQYIYNYI